MKNVRRLVPVLAGILGAAGAWGVSTVGCSSNGGSTGGGGPDATADAEGDGQADVFTEAQSDTSSMGDSQTDVFVVDTGTGADAAPDGDAGLADVYDASAALAFPAQLATAICNNYAACCGTTGDAAAFNWTLCWDGMLPQGFHGSNTGAQSFDRGNIAFDPVQAQLCLNAITSIDCVANQVTATGQTQRYQSCFATYAGTLATGSPCATTMECAPDNFCSPVDGGVGDSGAIGVCQALVGDGGACGFLSANQAVDQAVCSYLGSASNGLFCKNITGPDAATTIPPAQFTCQQQWGLGSDCWTNQDCTTFICAPVAGVYQCSNAGSFAYPSTCAGYLIADAGGGG